MCKRDGKRREMGLGRAGMGGVSLATARKAAAKARDALEHGKNPTVERDAERAPAVVAPTFGEVADEFVEGQGLQWRNEKHRAQWSMTLKVYAKPLRELPVDQIDTAAAVLGTLKPIWTKKPETASRVRGRIERVLDAAKAKGFRSGENPARWRGHLDHGLGHDLKLVLRLRHLCSNLGVSE